MLRKDEEDKANGLVSPLNDAIIWDIWDKILKALSCTIESWMLLGGLLSP